MPKSMSLKSITIISQKLFIYPDFEMHAKKI